MQSLTYGMLLSLVSVSDHLGDPAPEERLAGPMALHVHKQLPLAPSGSGGDEATGPRRRTGGAKQGGRARVHLAF